METKSFDPELARQMFGERREIGRAISEVISRGFTLKIQPDGDGGIHFWCMKGTDKYKDHYARGITDHRDTELIERILVATPAIFERSDFNSEDDES